MYSAFGWGGMANGTTLSAGLERLPSRIDGQSVRKSCLLAR